jgi:deferrochelatase/peroxidase EfeB
MTAGWSRQACRGLLCAAALAAGAAATAAGSRRVEPFRGRHQGGIVTPQQTDTYFAAFDLVTASREEVIALLRRWTAAAARMSQGRTAGPLGQDPGVPAGDTLDVLGLPPSRLTLTFGFGAGLFVKDGVDRYGLAARRPEALVDLPAFAGDQLVAGSTGGDLSVQACADEPQVAFHAVRQLARLAEGVAQLRWVQAGHFGDFGRGATGRNLMGFLDGTGNPAVGDARLMDRFVWVGSEGPGWMRGGSYVVARRSRIALEHWDRMNVAFQEQTFGRRKRTGAPLGGRREKDPVRLDATDGDGNPVIAENAHVRLGNRDRNGGMQILRRSYNYNDGLDFTAERWPPWRQGLEYDAGLLFICYQRDPRTGFIPMFQQMAKLDLLNQFVTGTGGALFACPGGVARGEFIGQRLFEPPVAGAAPAMLAEDPVAGVEVTLQDHRFVPAEIHVKAGKPTFLTVTNRDATPEEFELLQLAIEKVIPGGGQGKVRLRPLGPGRYPFRGEFHQDTAQGAVIAE